MQIECANTIKIAFKHKKIENPVLLEYAKKLPNQGVLKRDNTSIYYYLKIEDDFIFKLFPLIKELHLSVPNYFPPKCDIGTHISIMYPAEISSKNTDIDELEQSFSFEVTGFFSLSVFDKTFFALTVSSPSLEQLRLKYGLSTKLNYHGLLVPFHITIANQQSYTVFLK